MAKHSQDKFPSKDLSDSGTLMDDFSTEGTFRINRSTVSERIMMEIIDFITLTLHKYDSLFHHRNVDVIEHELKGLSKAVSTLFQDNEEVADVILESSMYLLFESYSTLKGAITKYEEQSDDLFDNMIEKSIICMIIDGIRIIKNNKIAYELLKRLKRQIKQDRIRKSETSK